MMLKAHRLDVLLAVLGGLLVGDECVPVHRHRRPTLTTVRRLLVKWLPQPNYTKSLPLQHNQNIVKRNFRRKMVRSKLGIDHSVPRDIN